MKVLLRALFVLILSFSIVSIIQCSGQQVIKSGDTEVLGLEQIFSMDSTSIKEEESIFFSDFAKDADGSIYLMDGDSVRVYHFDESGELMRSFLKKGEGPGEFLGYPKLQLSGEYLWVLGRRKIGKFRKTGEFIEEYKQKSYFSAIHVVDEIHFLGTKERFPEDKNGKTITIKILGLFTLDNEKLKTTYFETKSNGRIFIPVGKRQISVIPGDGLVPDLKFGFSQFRDEVLYADTNFFKIYRQHLTGDKKREFEIKTKKVPVSKELKERILKTFGNIRDDLKKKIFEGLPNSFCAIKKIRVLQNNSILIESLFLGGESVFDLYDENGNFIKRFKIEPGFKYQELKFFDGRIGMIEDLDESSVYHEFKISDSLFK